MENKKKMIVIVSILLIYLVIMIIVYGIDKVKNKFYHLDVLMSPNTYLKYENGKWKDEKETQTSMLGKTYKIAIIYMMEYYNIQMKNGMLLIIMISLYHFQKIFSLIEGM